MIREKFDKKSIMQWIWAFIAAISMTSLVYAVPAANTQITNAASVTYVSGGQTYTAQSNIATITVAPIYFAKLEGGIDQQAAPAKTVYVPYTLTNTGNIEDTFTIDGGLLAADGKNVDLSQKLDVYIDSNKNGQADTAESKVTSYTLPMGSSVKLVLLYQMPKDAPAGTKVKVGIKVTSTGSDNESKITDSDGNDVDKDNTTTDANTYNNDATLQNTITLNTGAVLTATQTQSVDTTTDTSHDIITYTLNVSNVGVADAKNVMIMDAYPVLSELPAEHTDDDHGAYDVNYTGFVDKDDKKDYGIQDVAEPKLDLNQNGENTDTVKVVQAFDKLLPKQSTVSISFKIKVPKNLPKDQSIENTFFAFEAALNADSTALEDPLAVATGKFAAQSATIEYKVVADIGVEVQDIGGTPTPGENDGGDDDGTNNKVQVVDVSSAGETVLFPISIKNTGNTSTEYTISTDIGTFPSGTTFMYWDTRGPLQKNSEVTIESDKTQIIMVRAKLPKTVVELGPYNAIVTVMATSYPHIKGTVTLTLKKMTASAARKITILPNGNNQITPSGSVIYKHTLTNEGSQSETVYFDVENSLAKWGSNLMFDANNDGSPEGEQNVDALDDQTQVTVGYIDGTADAKVKVGKIGKGTPTERTTITLQPGQFVRLFNVTQAPGDSKVKDENIATITVIPLRADGSVDPDLEAPSVRDFTTVSEGQVRLYKTAAVDANCDGVAEGGFEESQNTKVEPGQCIIWQLVAINEGSSEVSDIIVLDGIPQYTTYLGDSLKYCKGDCTDANWAEASAARTDAKDGDTAQATDGDITFYVGTGATATVGGTLPSGERATMRFTVKVDQ